MKRLGYTLIEVAMVLVILGIFVGGALTPLRLRYVSGQYEETEIFLQKAQDAVEGFALSHTTRQRTVRYYDGQDYTVPGGRPYLPCPDVTGDGREDRHPIPEGGAVALAVLRPDIEINGETLNVEVVTSPGACLFQKGFLPWRSLGMDGGADVWGNLLIYRVDLAFSDSLLGFDAITYADSFDPRRQVETIVVPNQDAVSFYRQRQLGNDNGAIVCQSDQRVDFGSAATIGCPSALSHLNLGGIRIEAGPPTGWLARTPFGDEGVLFPPARARRVSVGIITDGLPDTATDRAERNRNARDYAEEWLRPGNVVDGIVFVVLSTGENQYGAFRVETNNRDETEIRCTADRRRTGTPSFAEDVFVTAGGFIINHYDSANYWVRDGHPITRHNSCRELEIRRHVGVYNEASFVFAVNPFLNQNDDVGIWTSSQQLMGILLRESIFPVTCVPFLPDVGVENSLAVCEGDEK